MEHGRQLGQRHPSGRPRCGDPCWEKPPAMEQCHTHLYRKPHAAEQCGAKHRLDDSTSWFLQCTGYPRINQNLHEPRILDHHPYGWNGHSSGNPTPGQCPVRSWLFHSRRCHVTVQLSHQRLKPTAVARKRPRLLYRQFQRSEYLR